MTTTFSEPGFPPNVYPPNAPEGTNLRPPVVVAPSLDPALRDLADARTPVVTEHKPEHFVPTSF
jgi:hypothetical protein